MKTIASDNLLSVKGFIAKYYVFDASLMHKLKFSGEIMKRKQKLERKPREHREQQAIEF